MRTSVPLAILAFVVGCGVSPELEEPGLAPEQQSQELVADTGLYWPRTWNYEAPNWVQGPTIIDVCFLSGSPALREQTRNRVERTWQRAARVTFRWWGDCTPGLNGIRIDFRTAPGMGSASEFGTNALGKNMSMVLDPFDTQGGTARFELVITHEFGHALSFAHSECRSDYQPQGDRNLNGVLDTLESFQGGNPCAAPVPACSGTRTYGAYDVRSVMSACGRFSVNLPTFSIGLSPNDTAGVQSAYGRKLPGQLVTPRGKCLTMPSASQGITYDCDEREDKQELRLQLANETLDSRGACLEAAPWIGGSPNVFLYPHCDGYSGQKWRFESVSILGWGGLCLDLENGATNGGAVQLFECGAAGGVNQRWTPTASGEIKFGGATSGSCLTAASGALKVAPCNGTASQRFDLLAGGQIRERAGGTCADVPAPFAASYSPASGANGAGLPASRLPLNTFACLGDQLNQRFHLSGPVRHVATSHCLERVGDGHDNGTLVQRATCNGTEAQTWDYYPL